MAKEHLLGNKAKELLMHTTKLTMNTKLFPKSVRFTYCHELQRLCLAILKNIHAADECFFETEHKKRLEHIKLVMDDCNLMLKLLEVCLELGYIDIDRCKHWTNLVLPIKYMSASWYKKDGARSKAIIVKAEQQEITKQQAMLQTIIQGIRG